MAKKISATQFERESVLNRAKFFRTSGTPKEKAEFICHEYHDKSRGQGTSYLTAEDVEAIKCSLRSKEEADEYNRYINCYNVYDDLLVTIGCVLKEYQAQAERVIGRIREWEMWDYVGELLTDYYDTLSERGDEKSKKIFTDFLALRRFKDTRYEIREDGRITAEETTIILRQTIQEEVDRMNITYVHAKALVIALNDFARRTDSATLMPSLIKSAIEVIRADYARFVGFQYSRDSLRKRIEEGEYISVEERRRAVIPCYEEVDIDKYYVDMFKRQIQRTEKKYQICEMIQIKKSSK